MSTSAHGSRLVLRIAGILALIAFVGSGLVLALLVGRSVAAGAVLPRSLVLELDLTTPPVESSATDVVTALVMGTDRMTVRDVVDALDRAGTDARVKGVVFTIDGGSGGMAVAQEVRDALRAFRDRGKFVIAFSETFGESAAGNGGYYVATAADEIVLQPSGDVGLVGLVWQAEFLEGTLAKLEIQPQLDQRWEYKAAMNQYTEAAFTAAHREEAQAVLVAQQEQLVAGIAAGRGLAPAKVEALVDRGPFLAAEALEAGLVDRLDYRDAAYDRARSRAGGATFLDMGKYLSRAGRPNRSGPKIALVYGVGTIVKGASTFDPLSGTSTMGSESVAAAIREAVEDDSVRAILFRVDSPGGSYVASDTVWNEVRRARAAGKPVIVSMGNVAGSGGYFVAMGADKIVAQPGTVTGSIGVFAGKFVTRDFLANKLGITVDSLAVSDNARMYLLTSPYTPAEWQRVEALLDRVYKDFTSKAADGRGLAAADVEAAARGRIWVGTDALRLRLVDELGGFPTALRLVREAIGLDADAPVRVVVYPQERGWWQRLFGPTSGVGAAAGGTAVRGFLEEVRPLVRQAEALGLLGDDADTLAMPLVPPLP